MSTVTAVIAADGIHLAVERWDPHGAPLGTVVLLHGGGQTRHAWRGAGERLARAGWAALAYDARGHGESEWSASEDYSLETMARDLRAVVAQLSRSPVLVGASMGGNVSLLAASQQPGLCRALILVDIVPRTDPRGVERIVSFMTDRPDGFESLEEVAAAVASYKGTPPQLDRLDGLRKNVRLGDDGRWRWHWDPAYVLHVQRYSRHGYSALLEAAAAAITVPTLVLRGEASDVIGASQIEQFIETQPNVTAVEVPGASHTVGGDENSAFIDALLRFLAASNPSEVARTKRDLGQR